MAAGSPICNVIAAVLGHVPESYDFTIFSSLFGFFPANDPLTGLLLAVSTLGIGVVARPLGGPLFGAYSDATAANRR
jgi:hypothetical protein